MAESYLESNGQIEIQNTKSKILLELIDNKSNCLENAFVEQLRALLIKINPFVNKIDFSNMCLEGKAPIKFDKISQNQIEDMYVF